MGKQLKIITFSVSIQGLVFLCNTLINRGEIMNLDFKRDDFRFNARVSAIIYNKDLNKVLLFNVEGRDFYMLPGGRIEELEESIDTIKREIKEEIGWDNVTYKFLALSEEFVNDKGYNNHQINIIYKGICNDEIKETKFKGLEGDWINFEWVDISIYISTRYFQMEFIV